MIQKCHIQYVEIIEIDECVLKIVESHLMQSRTKMYGVLCAHDEWLVNSSPYIVWA